MKKKIKFDLARYEQGNCEVVDEVGNKVRIFATDFKFNDEQLIIGAVTLNDNFEADILWHRDGTEVERNDKHSLCLLVDEYPFKPFDRVLARYDDEDKWQCDFFIQYDKDSECPYQCFNRNFCQCIPYVDNEELFDTTDAPKGGEK
jgi:hypothetical protein